MYMAGRVKASRGMVRSGLGKGGFGLLFAYKDYSASSCYPGNEHS